MKPEGVLGLATGSTPIGLYSQLVEWYKQGDLSFAGIRSVNLDEYLGLAPTHEQSYRYFMQQNLFDHIDIKPENTHVLNGLAADPDAECAAYDQLIRELGGVDLQLLGIGHNGHIGFNEPGSSLSSGTRMKTLHASTISDNARFFESTSDVPVHVLTQGLGTISRAGHLMLLATGSNKAEAVAALAEGPLSAICPASILQLHPHATVIVDEAAAGQLRHADYYRFTEANKPSWQGH